MLVFAFFSLGLLIGNLAGMTSAEVTVPLVAALFAFGGGSAIAFMDKLGPEKMAGAMKAIVGISLGCLIGVHAGIYVSEHRLLSPAPARHDSTAAAAGTRDRTHGRAPDAGAGGRPAATGVGDSAGAVDRGRPENPAPATTIPKTVAPAEKSPESSTETKESQQAARKTYLRNDVLPAVESIDQKVANGILTKEQAYEELYKLLQQEAGE